MGGGGAYTRVIWGKRPPRFWAQVQIYKVEQNIIKMVIKYKYS